MYGKRFPVFLCVDVKRQLRGSFRCVLLHRRTSILPKHVLVFRLRHDLLVETPLVNLDGTPAQPAPSKHERNRSSMHSHDLRPFHLAQPRLVRKPQKRASPHDQDDKLNPKVLLLSGDMIVANLRVVISPETVIIPDKTEIRQQYLRHIAAEQAMTRLVRAKSIRACQTDPQSNIRRQPILLPSSSMTSPIPRLPKNCLPNPISMPTHLHQHTRPHHQPKHSQQPPHPPLVPIIPRLRHGPWTHPSPPTITPLQQLRSVQIIHDPIVIRAINLHLRPWRASRANLRIPLLQIALPLRQRALVLQVLRVVLVGEVIRQRLVVNSLITQASIAENLLRLVASRRVGGGIAREALEDLLRLVERLGVGRGGAPGRVGDGARGVEVVVRFARGALEAADAGGFGVGGARAAEVAFDAAEDEVHFSLSTAGVEGVVVLPVVGGVCLQVCV